MSLIASTACSASESATSGPYCAPMGGVDLDRFSAGYRRNTEALHRGDLEAAFGWIPPEFEWHVLADSLPGDIRPDAPPVLHGREAVVSYFQQLIEDWNWR